MRLLKLSLSLLSIWNARGISEVTLHGKLALVRNLSRLRKRIEVFLHPMNSQCIPEAGYDKVYISILMSANTTDSKALARIVESVFAQTNKNWELCISVNCSANNEIHEVLSNYRGCDPRIKIIQLPSGKHSANYTNPAIEFATGEFITFLDSIDILGPDTIKHLVNSILQFPDGDLLYVDDDKIKVGSSETLTLQKLNELQCSATHLIPHPAIRKRLLLRLEE